MQRDRTVLHLRKVAKWELVGGGIKHEALQGGGWLCGYIWKMQPLNQSINLFSNQGSPVVLREFVLLGLEAQVAAAVCHFF